MSLVCSFSGLLSSAVIQVIYQNKVEYYITLIRHQIQTNRTINSWLSTLRSTSATSLCVFSEVERGEQLSGNP